MFLELDRPAIGIVPESDPWNVLKIVQENELGIDIRIDLGINLGNALQDASIHSRDHTSNHESRLSAGD